MNATTVQIRLMILNDAADGFIPKQKKRAFKSLRRYYYAAALSSKTHTAEKKAALCCRRVREMTVPRISHSPPEHVSHTSSAQTQAVVATLKCFTPQRERIPRPNLTLHSVEMPSNSQRTLVPVRCFGLFDFLHEFIFYSTVKSFFSTAAQYRDEFLSFFFTLCVFCSIFFRIVFLISHSRGLLVQGARRVKWM